MIQDLVDVVGSPGALWSYGVVVVVFGFAPGFVLRLVLLLYPPGDVRRRELLAELYALRRIWRPVWVAQQIETALFEAPRARARVKRGRAQASVVGWFLRELGPMVVIAAAGILGVIISTFLINAPGTVAWIIAALSIAGQFVMLVKLIRANRPRRASRRR